MDGRSIDSLGVIAMFVICSAAAWWFTIYSHEQVHVRACVSYGGEAEVVWGLTTAKTYCNLPMMSEAKYEDWLLVNMQNEVVGYTAQAVIFTMIVMAATMTMALLLRREDEMQFRELMEVREAIMDEVGERKDQGS